MAKHFDKKDDIPLDTLNQSSDSISIHDQLSPGIDEGISQNYSTNLKQELVLGTTAGVSEEGEHDCSEKFISHKQMKGDS